MVAVLHSHPIESPQLQLVLLPDLCLLDDHAMPDDGNLPDRDDLLYDQASTALGNDSDVGSYAARRCVGVALVAVMIWLAFTTATTLASWATGAGEPTFPGNGGPVSYTIQPGDTVWSVARQYQPGGDVRPFVDEIVELNGGPNIVVGQELVLVP